MTLVTGGVVDAEAVDPVELCGVADFLLTCLFCRCVLSRRGHQISVK